MVTTGCWWMQLIMASTHGVNQPATTCEPDWPRRSVDQICQDDNPLQKIVEELLLTSTNMIPLWLCTLEYSTSASPAAAFPTTDIL